MLAPCAGSVVGVRGVVGIGALGLLAGCSCQQDADDVAPSARTPDRVVLHRLNRAEYDNTVRDLFGTTLTPAIDFPYDDTSHGFDNIAATLTVSPLHVELYERAADQLATEALSIGLTELYRERFEGEGTDVTASTGGVGSDYWNLWSNGELTALVDLPEDGQYALRTRVWADQGGPDLAQMTLGLDGNLDALVDVLGDSRDNAELHEVLVDSTAGVHAFSVGFTNDYYDPYAGVDRNLLVDWLEIEGPLDAQPGPNPIREALVVCDPSGPEDSACAREVLDGFLPRAWRRPVTPLELDSLVDLFEAVVDDGGTWDDGMHMALVAALLSPHFTYRVELVDDPTSATPQPLDGYEVASRLSYFLWSSMPDDALFAAAADGTLDTPAGVEAQVARMLADPRADALVDNFAGQWLHIRAIEGKAPDVWAYPDFDENLRVSMIEEMERFFASFITADRDLRELLSATEGAIDARLAEHYELDPVTGWETVDLGAEGRGGLLGQAGMLMVNSYPARTSPVLRGKWVLGQLLCSEPPPPPPEVEGLIEEDADARTVRERLAQHRADPACAVCHDAMDPIGLSMEHFDGTGAWRETDNGQLVDASGILIDGTSFYGARELAAILAQDPEFTDCIAEQLFTYAIGRSPNGGDAAALEEVRTRFAAGGHSFGALAAAIASSDPFRLTSGEEAP